MTPPGESFQERPLKVQRIGVPERRPDREIKRVLWGSLAQAIKAVAALRKINLPTPGAIWEFTRQLCQEIGDSSLFDAFKDANRLHANFYEAGMTREMVIDSEVTIRQGVARLIGLIPPEVMIR